MVEEYVRAECQRANGRDLNLHSCLPRRAAGKLVSPGAEQVRFNHLGRRKTSAEETDEPVKFIARLVEAPSTCSLFEISAAAVIVLGLGLGIWRAFFYQSEVAKGWLRSRRLIVLNVRSKRAYQD